MMMKRKPRKFRLNVINKYSCADLSLEAMVIRKQLSEDIAKQNCQSMFLKDHDCRAQRAYVNIPAWHEAGYKGQGITAFCDDVGGNHAQSVADILRVILPEAQILTGRVNFMIRNDEVTDCSVSCRETGRTESFDEFILSHGVSLLNNSKDGGDGRPHSPLSRFMEGRIRRYNLIVTGSAGNGFDLPINNRLYGSCIIVNSARMKKGRPVHSPCAIGGGIDFCMFNGFQPGTSFAAPFLLGLAGLLRSRRPHLTQEEVYRYLKEHAEPVGCPEKNIYTGWGLPILGDPLL